MHRSLVPISSTSMPSRAAISSAAAIARDDSSITMVNVLSLTSRVRTSIGIASKPFQAVVREIDRVPNGGNF